MQKTARSLRYTPVALLLAGALNLGVAQAQKPDKKPRPYPLETCLVSGEKLGQGGMKPHAFTHQGREIKLCCQDCLKDFNQAPARFIQKLEAAAKPYPLDTCLVSGEALGSGGMTPYGFAYQGREIQLCCKSCLKYFNKEPAKFIKKLEAAEKAAKDAQKPEGSTGGQNGNCCSTGGQEGHGGHQH